MFASAPLFGVGVGRYFERSSEFMPDEIRALYGAENAHNYFAQVFAELGVVGGALFVWLIVGGTDRRMASGRERRSAIPRRSRSSPAQPGYLVTCLTGHPFLVAEAALPFWVAFGALVARGREHSRRDLAPSRRHPVVLLFAVVVLARATVALRAYGRQPPERGFVGEATAADGTRFRWMGPHVVTLCAAGSQASSRLTLRPPDRPLPRPMDGRDPRSVAASSIAATLVPGRVANGADPGARTVATARFRRIDVRASRSWMDKRKLAQRTAEVDVAVTAMVSEMRWIGPGER